MQNCELWPRFFSEKYRHNFSPNATIALWQCWYKAVGSLKLPCDSKVDTTLVQIAFEYTWKTLQGFNPCESFPSQRGSLGPVWSLNIGPCNWSRVWALSLHHLTYYTGSLTRRWVSYVMTSSHINDTPLSHIRTNQPQRCSCPSRQRDRGI